MVIQKSSIGETVNKSIRLSEQEKNIHHSLQGFELHPQDSLNLGQQPRL
jgi:hypothetical protein